MEYHSCMAAAQNEVVLPITILLQLVLHLFFFFFLIINDIICSSTHTYVRTYSLTLKLHYNARSLWHHP